MSDAIRPIDVACPTCGCEPQEACRISTWQRVSGIKSTHPERVKAARMSPAASYLRAARRASESPVPYADDRVVFLWNAGTRTSANHLRFANTVPDKIRLLSGRRRKVYCVWAGETRSDLFWIDNPNLALHVLLESGVTHGT